MRHSEITAIVSFLVLFFSACLSTDFFSQYLCLVYLPKDFDLEIVGSKSKNWTPSAQHAEPQGGFCVIKLYHLKGSFSAVPVGQREKRWREFFLDPSQWWDHGSEKVTEHQSCQNSPVLLMLTLLFALGCYSVVV
jgi:hypothetical protein